MKKYKYSFVYKTINKINNKEYTGVHSANVLSDDYLGSGALLHRAIKKYGKHNFQRIILKQFDSDIDAFKYEAEIVNEEYVKRKDTYNVTIGGANPPRRYGKDHHGYIDVSVETTNEILKLYDSGKGLSMDNISIKLNLSGSVIKRIMHENNVDTTHATVHRLKKLGRTYEQIMGEEKAKKHKLDVSNANKGRKFTLSDEVLTPEYRQMLADRARKLHTGRKRTQETKDKMSVAIKNSQKHKDSTSSPEFKKKISDWMKNQLANPDSVYNSIECKNKMLSSRKRYYELHPKIKKEDLVNVISNCDTINNAFKYYCDKYKKVSYPTFRAYLKKYQII